MKKYCLIMLTTLYLCCALSVTRHMEEIIVTALLLFKRMLKKEQENLELHFLNEATQYFEVNIIV